MVIVGILTGLFVSAFTSATLLPGTSEAVLVGILAGGNVPTMLAVLVATIGNTLGSCVNWGIGAFAERLSHHKRFKIDPAKLERYSRWYRKWGVWSLLASWMPIIGDPLTVVAGLARTPLALFSAIVFVAKGVRYLIVAGLFSLVT
ncbi:MAG: DedA family protein [Rhizobiaceae bacterium]|nr:DedA family protein [Rhizobiaceae bacterium]